MQQKMILQSIRTDEMPTENTLPTALSRGLLLAFAEAGLLTEKQVRTALAKLEKP